ncbi:MAG: hypothetical protein KJ559_00885 [Nanoarchaeota archaeon]|nr:hypothetical protein [Nanoarchaeota archaeon]
MGINKKKVLLSYSFAQSEEYESFVQKLKTLGNINLLQREGSTILRTIQGIEKLAPDVVIISLKYGYSGREYPGLHLAKYLKQENGSRVYVENLVNKVETPLELKEAKKQGDIDGFFDDENSFMKFLEMLNDTR